MRRQDQGADLGEFCTDLPRSIQALGQITRWHPDVDDGQVRMLLTDLRQQFVGIAGLADHVKPRAPQQACYALPEQRVVVGQGDALARFVHNAPVTTSLPWMTGPRAAWRVG